MGCLPFFKGSVLWGAPGVGLAAGFLLSEQLFLAGLVLWLCVLSRCRVCGVLFLGFFLVLASRDF
jgi:hypothetical protein